MSHPSRVPNPCNPSHHYQTGERGMGSKRRGHKDKAPATEPSLPPPSPSSDKKPEPSKKKKKRKRSGSRAEIPNPKPISPLVAAPSIEDEDGDDARDDDGNGQYALKPNPQAAASASVNQSPPNNDEDKEMDEKMDDDEKKSEEEEAAEEKSQRPVKKPRAVNEPTSGQPQPNLPSSKNKSRSLKKKRNTMAPEPSIPPPAASPPIEDEDNDSGEDDDDQYILKPKQPQPGEVDEEEEEMEIEENKDGGSDDEDENQPSKDAKDDSDSGESAASEEDEGSSIDKNRPPLKPVPESEPAEDDEEAPEKPGGAASDPSKPEPITEREHASQDGDDGANCDSGSDGRAPEKTITVDEPSQPAAAAAAANKRMKTGESQEPQSGEQKKKQQHVFSRVFALDDEITILRGLVEYRDAKGVVPSTGKHMQEFYSIVQPSLGSLIKVGQLSDKVRRMRKKFESAAAHVKSGVELVFADEHDRNVYEISKGIWGLAADDNVTDVTDAGPSSMRNKRHGSEEQVGEDKEGKVITSCKFLGEALASIDNKHSIGVAAKRVFEDVDENKIIGLEEKFRKQRTATVKHDLQRMDLLKDSVKLLMDGIANAG